MRPPDDADELRVRAARVPGRESDYDLVVWESVWIVHSPTRGSLAYCSSPQEAARVLEQLRTGGRAP